MHIIRLVLSLYLNYIIIGVIEGDDEKLSSVRLLRGYIELLGPHIRNVLRSDVHLRRLSSALIHVLQFDCCLIHIIEQRTAGQCFLIYAVDGVLFMVGTL